MKLQSLTRLADSARHVLNVSVCVYILGFNNCQMCWNYFDVIALVSIKLKVVVRFDVRNPSKSWLWFLCFKRQDLEIFPLGCRKSSKCPSRKSSKCPSLSRSSVHSQYSKSWLLNLYDWSFMQEVTINCRKLPYCHVLIFNWIYLNENLYDIVFLCILLSLQLFRLL